MEPLLMAENLTKVYKRTGQADFTAVDHISFALQPGECLGIIGESGSGKSTVAGMITRLTDATRPRNPSIPAAGWETVSVRVCGTQVCPVRKSGSAYPGSSRSAVCRRILQTVTRIRCQADSASALPLRVLSPSGRRC